MSSHINLMTNRARVQECSRTRVRQWSRILAVVVGLLVLHASITWLPVHVNSRQRALLETQYGPLRQMKTTNKKLAAQIASTLDQSQLELALSRQTPVLTMVGLVSKAVSESSGTIYLEQIAYTRDGESDETTEGALTLLELKGVCADPVAVEQLAQSLRTAFPFAEVKLEPFESIELNAHLLNSFQIECSF
jgi:hypothetical protein